MIVYTAGQNEEYLIIEEYDIVLTQVLIMQTSPTVHARMLGPDKVALTCTDVRSGQGCPNMHVQQCIYLRTLKPLRIPLKSIQSPTLITGHCLVLSA